MTNVLHHLPESRRFSGRAPAFVPGGALVMIEPWVTRWSGLVYRRSITSRSIPAHVRGIVVAARFPAPMARCLGFSSSATAATRGEFPQWRVEQVEPFMPFRYLMTGGFSMRTLAPRWLFTSCAVVEHGLRPWMGQLAMFALLVVRRTGTVTR